MKYYTPKTKQIKPLNIGKTRKVSFDAGAMRDIFAKHIYSNPEAGFRELYANSIRACREAEEEYKTSPYIEMIIDPSTLDFTMIEHDSTGITQQIFDDVLMVLGRSSNFNGSHPGMFGIGIAAYFALSDNMFLQSRARNGDELSYLIREMKSAEDISEQNPVDLETYGTKITLKMQHLKEMKNYSGVNDKTNWSLLENVVEYLENLAKFSGVKTVLTIVNAPDEWEGPTDGTTIIGTIEVESLISPKDSNDMLFKMHGDDYELVMCNKSTQRIHDLKHATLIGIPISADDFNDFFSELDAFYFNIKNERTYPPIASRDRFSDESIESIKNLFRKDLHEWLSQYSYINTIGRWTSASNHAKNYVYLVSQMASIDVDDELDPLIEIAGLFQKRYNVWSRGTYFGARTSLDDIYDDGMENICCIRTEDSFLIKSLSDYVVILQNDNFDVLSKYFKNGHDIKDVKKVMEIYRGNYDFNEPSIVDESKILDTFIRTSEPEKYAKICYQSEIESVYTFFDGDEGGIKMEDFIRNVFNKEHDGKKGADIIYENDLVLCAENPLIEDLKQGDLGEYHVCMDYTDAEELAMANILNNGRRKLIILDYEQICHRLGKKYGYGVDFKGCTSLEEIIASLDKISDSTLRRSLAMLYSESCKHASANEVETLIMEVETCLSVSEQVDLFDTILFLAMEVQNPLNNVNLDNVWKNILLMSMPGEREAGIVKALGGILNDKSINISYTIKGHATIGGDMMDRLIELEVIEGIKNITTYDIDGEQYIDVVLRW